jgi:hypothetical protein
MSEKVLLSKGLDVEKEPDRKISKRRGNRQKGHPINTLKKILADLRNKEDVRSRVSSVEIRWER